MDIVTSNRLRRICSSDRKKLTGPIKSVSYVSTNYDPLNPIALLSIYIEALAQDEIRTGQSVGKLSLCLERE